MSEFKQMEQREQRKNYWSGSEKKFVRSWMYAQKGLQEFNEFKYFVLAFVGFVGLLYLKVPLMWIIITMIILVPIALIVLILFGRWHITRAGPTEQWVRTEFGSVLKYNDYNIKVQTLNNLEEISKKLDKLISK